MPSFYAPHFEVLVDGEPWSQSIHGGVVMSIEIRDKEGENTLLRMNIGGLTIDQMGSEAFRDGVVVGLKLGYTDYLFDWGNFKVNKPQYNFSSGSSCSVLLEGISVASGGAMTVFEVNEVFKGMSIRGIVTQIAEKYGFTADFGHQTTDGTMGSDPRLDKTFPVIATGGRTHWSFLKYLSASIGRYVHIDNEQIDFWLVQKQPAVLATGDDFVEEGGYGRDRMDVDLSGKLSGAVSGNRGDKVEDDVVDPYIDTRSKLVFTWDEDNQDHGVFNIWNVSINENKKAGGGKVGGDTLDEGSAESQSVEADPENEMWMDLGKDGLMNRDGETLFGTPLFGWSTRNKSEPPTKKSKIDAAKARYGKEVVDLHLASESKAAGKTVESVKQEQGMDNSWMDEALKGLTDAMDILPGKYLKPGAEGDGAAWGLDGGSEEEMKDVLQSDADSAEYGIFLAFTSFGIPGVKARRSTYLNNLSRWSGDTYLKEVTHSLTTSGGYIMNMRSRAPGTFNPTPVSDNTSDMDNPNADDVGDTIDEPRMNLNTRSPYDPSDGFWTAAEGKQQTTATGKRSTKFTGESVVGDE